MVGSENDPQDSRAWPVLTSLGKEPMHMGAVGTAAATKLALNQLIASLTVSAAISQQRASSAIGVSCSSPLQLTPYSYTGMLAHAAS